MKPMENRTPTLWVTVTVITPSPSKLVPTTIGELMRIPSHHSTKTAVLTPWLLKVVVWKFTTHNGKAYNPKPQDGATALSEPLALSWTAGDWTQPATGHRVFFSTSYGEVAAATITKTTGVYRGTVSDPVYPLSRLAEMGPVNPGGSWVLQPGTTYYWRIDEVNGTTVYGGPPGGAVPSPSPSPIWSFTPAAYINIDDFEDYNSADDVNVNWPNHYSITGCPAFFWRSAVRFFMDDAAGKYLRLHITTRGSVAFSEAKRPYTYSGGTSFTGGSVISPKARALRIDYLGSPTNAVHQVDDRMYVAIEDTAGNVSVYQNPDGNAAIVTVWTSWYSSLYDINGAVDPPVKLEAISGFAIGFGTRCSNWWRPVATAT